MKKLSLIISVLTILLVLAACGNSGSSSSKKLQVVTTFYPMYDFTKNITGNNADIHMLIEAGTEPHDYEPSAKDIAKIEEADFFVYNSNDMETWVPKVLKNIDRKKTTVIEASKGIKLLEGVEEEEEHGDDHGHAHDPHVWLSPALAQKEVATIEAGLKKADKKRTSTYEKNAKTYTAKLEKLDNDFKDGLKGAKNRDFVTQHAAFQYLAKEYDLHQIAIAGLSPDQEPSPKRLAELQKFVKKHDTKIIYFEEVASPKIAQTLADETGAKMEVLSPIEGITAKEQKQGIDYISYMEDNLKALQKTIK